MGQCLCSGLQDRRARTASRRLRIVAEPRRKPTQLSRKNDQLGDDLIIAFAGSVELALEKKGEIVERLGDVSCVFRGRHCSLAVCRGPSGG
jgi:hypothetical protein